MSAEVTHLRREVVERTSFSKRHVILTLMEDGAEFCDPIVVGVGAVSCVVVKRTRDMFLGGKGMDEIIDALFDELFDPAKT